MRNIYIYTIKTITFIIIFIILWNYIFDILWLEDNSITYFYKEKKNAYDVVYIGPSNAYKHFNTTLAFNKEGFTTGLYSSDNFPFPNEKIIKEIQSYQNPKLFIVDISNLNFGSDILTTGVIRKISDNMPMSKNKFEFLNALLGEKGAKKDEYSNYYFSFLLYHNQWKNLSNLNFIDNPNYYKGYYMIKDSISVFKHDSVVWNEEKRSLTLYNREKLDNFINYVKENKINVIFVIPNRGYSLSEEMHLNDAINIINEKNLPVLNFNKLKELNINFDTDFYDVNHLNVYGVTKYTLYFSKYLKENYDLPDHRNDKEYSSWSSEYERFKESFKELTKKNFDELLQEYEKEY